MPDIGGLFRLDVSAVELVVRTSVVYLVLLVALRVVGRREMGALALPDMLLIVMIADGVQNGLAGEYKSITGALLVAGTLVGWNYALDMLTYHSATVRRLLQPDPLKLIEHGQLLRRNMRRELISVEELQAQLRTQGIADLSQVKLACLEPTGELSFIPYDTDTERPTGHDNKKAAR